MMRGALGGWLWPGVSAHVPDATLVMAERDLAGLRAHLLQADGLERAAFGLLGRCRSVEPGEYFLHRLLLPGDGDYRRQDGASVEPAPTYVLHTLHRLATSGAAGYLHAHSHPFSQGAAFSGTDDRFLRGEIATVRGYPRGADVRREVPFLRLVWGQREEGFSAEVYRGDGRIVARVRELRAVGPAGIRRIVAFAAAARASRIDDGTLPVARLDRNIRWLGGDGQQRLREPRLAVCGAGGIGSAWVAQARGLGFRRLILIDPDRVEPSNLNRLFGARLRDVGRLKVKVLAREVRALDPTAEVEIVPAPLQSEEARRALLRADLIVCGLDNMAARLEAQVVAARYLKPLLDMGSGIVLRPGTRQVQHMGAQAALYAPGGPCLLCQGVVNPSRILSPEHRALRRGLGYVEGAEEAAPPSVVTLNALVAALGLEALVRYLTGFGPAPTHLRYDSLA
ncbi:MAG: ThiF family adenylyltransferase [Candidatus Rokubacteria bacterium]|nr:ThiF family adenylyltransferase [Candidatus Rokubacteria bacterium]